MQAGSGLSIIDTAPGRSGGSLDDFMSGLLGAWLLILAITCAKLYDVQSRQGTPDGIRQQTGHC